MLANHMCVACVCSACVQGGLHVITHLLNRSFSCRFVLVDLSIDEHNEKDELPKIGPLRIIRWLWFCLPNRWPDMFCCQCSR